jgi:hypothetical protein
MQIGHMRTPALATARRGPFSAGDSPDALGGASTGAFMSQPQQGQTVRLLRKIVEHRLQRVAGMDVPLREI